MKRVEKHLRMLLLAFLAAYGGMAFAAPVVAVPGKSDSATAVQAPVDCKKTPKDPSCKEKKK